MVYHKLRMVGKESLSKALLIKSSIVGKHASCSGIVVQNLKHIHMEYMFMGGEI